MKIFYDIPYIKGIMMYVLVPVAIVIVTVGIALFIYSRVHKDHENPHYNFVMNFWSSLIGIIITGAILAMAVGFSIAMTEKMQEYGLVEEKKMLYYLLKYFIIIPFIFVVCYIVKFLKTIYYKPRKERIVKEQTPTTEKNLLDSNTIAETPAVALDTNISLNTANEVPQEIKSSVVVEEALQPLVQNNIATETETNTLPLMEETIEQEMKQFTKEEKTPQEVEELEVISLEDE